MEQHVHFATNVRDFFRPATIVFPAGFKRGAVFPEEKGT
jgi:hypothetical protein